MYKVINLEKLSADGFKMPANTPNEASLDNITHAQLRYDTYLTPNIIQGAVVSGENSTFVFNVTQTREDYKLYVSTDGTTYTENKLFGGTSGTQIIASDTILDPADFTNAVLRSNGTVFSALKIQSGTGINDMFFWNNSTSTWERQTFNTSTELIIGNNRYKSWITQTGTSNPVVVANWIRDGLVFTRVGAGEYKTTVAFSDEQLSENKLHNYLEVFPVYDNSNSLNGLLGYKRLVRSTDKLVQLNTYDTSFNLADDIITNGTTIDIRFKS